MPVFAIDERGCLRLQCALTIFQAGELWPALSAALCEGAVGEIDLGAVDEIDTAGLQLLLMLKRRAAEAGRALTLVNHSKPVLDLLGLANAARLLGDPLVLASGQAEGRA